MQTFRMPRELVVFLRNQADERGVDLTAYWIPRRPKLERVHEQPAPQLRLELGLRV